MILWLLKIVEERGYQRGLDAAIEVSKGHYGEYLMSCHGPKERDCGHKQASEWIREQLEALKAGTPLQKIIDPYLFEADSADKKC